jgi:hypothetical protein
VPKLINDTAIQKEIQVIASLQRDLNLATAVLLLTGQLTIIGVNVAPGGFSVSLSGPIFGRCRLEGKFGERVTNTVIDVIDILITILLIIDKIRIFRTMIGPDGFAVNVSGPIFGYPLSAPKLPILRKNYNFFHNIVSNHFNIDPKIFRNVERNEENVFE